MNNDLISRSELKKCAIPCQIHNGALTDLCVPLYQIDNAPTVETKKLEYKAYNDGFKDGVDQGINLSERPAGKWIRLDLAKKVIAKFEGYLDDDMIARIQIALERENEADMREGAE